MLRRRAPEQSGGVVAVGSLSLDADTYRVSWQEQALKVGPTEFKLLQFFMRHPERVPVSYTHLTLPTTSRV